MNHPNQAKKLNVTVFGATGLVGKSVVAALSQRKNVETIAVMRRRGSEPPRAGVVERIFDFSKADSYAALGGDGWPCDVLMCCIGSTMGAAGSKDAFLAIERDIPLAALTAIKKNPQARFVFVSSMGAGNPTGFYLQTKAAVEDGIRASGLSYVILRPSLMLGGRTEFRPGERLSQILLAPIFGLIDATPLKRTAAIASYRPIAGELVAKNAVHWGLDAPPAGVGSGKVVEGRDFYAWDTSSVKG